MLPLVSVKQTLHFGEYCGASLQKLSIIIFGDFEVGGRQPGAVPDKLAGRSGSNSGLVDERREKVRKTATTNSVQLHSIWLFLDRGYWTS